MARPNDTAANYAAIQSIAVLTDWIRDHTRMRHISPSQSAVIGLHLQPKLLGQLRIGVGVVDLGTNQSVSVFEVGVIVFSIFVGIFQFRSMFGVGFFKISRYRYFSYYAHAVAS